MISVAAGQGSPAQLLVEVELNVTQMAYAVDFDNLSHFAKGMASLPRTTVERPLHLP
ncbi:hypothetical protein GCM10027341_21470 [Spirosoma knui]